VHQQWLKVVFLLNFCLSRTEISLIANRTIFVLTKAQLFSVVNGLVVTVNLSQNETELSVHQWTVDDE
jgi:hypothetical protein